MSTLTQLSDELLLEILKYLHFGDICKLGTVNKQLKAISEDEDLWHNHPNILLVLPNENEFSEMLTDRKITSKNLARLRGAWNTFRFNVQQFHGSSRQLTPNRKLFTPTSIFEMLSISVLAKVELFHLLGWKNMAPSTNPFQTARNIITAHGWLGLFDGIGREIFMRLYYKTPIPRRYPYWDYLIHWIANSVTVFLETRTIPNKSHISKWVRAGTWSVLRQYVARRIMIYCFSRRRNFLLPTVLISLISVPFSAFTMRTLLGDTSVRESFKSSMQAALSWKLWLVPAVRLLVAFGSTGLKDAVVKLYQKWRHNALLKKERQKFLRVLDES
jgi:hypothetical protein